MNRYRSILPALACLGLLALSAPAPAPAQVYSWIDDQGRTHYGDAPPPDMPVRRLDPEHSAVTTIGGGGLRESERDRLRAIEQAEQAREQAAAERAARRPQVSVVTVEPPRDDDDDRVILYGPPYYPGYRHRYGHRDRDGWRAGLSFDWRVTDGLRLGGSAAAGDGLRRPPGRGRSLRDVERFRAGDGAPSLRPEPGRRPQARFRPRSEGVRARP